MISVREKSKSYLRGDTYESANATFFLGTIVSLSELVGAGQLSGPGCALVAGGSGKNA